MEEEKYIKKWFQNNIIGIQSGMLAFVYVGILICFLSLRTVISIFFIGICTDTSVFEAV